MIAHLKTKIAFSTIYLDFAHHPFVSISPDYRDFYSIKKKKKKKKKKRETWGQTGLSHSRMKI